MTKRILIFMLLSTTLLLLITGCGKSPSYTIEAIPYSMNEEEIDVDITEKMYVTYINEIYLNAEDYIGQNIRIQGMFQSYTDESTDSTYYFVYRIGPGCCGNDGDMCGFEFTWDGKIPEENDWIEVIGTLRSYEYDGWPVLVLDASSVTVQKERGEENVFQ